MKAYKTKYRCKVLLGKPRIVQVYDLKEAIVDDSPEPNRTLGVLSLARYRDCIVSGCRPSYATIPAQTNRDNDIDVYGLNYESA